MGEVVRLQRDEEPRRSAKRADAGRAPCQILIFTGVRYERWTDESTPPSPAPAPAPASKRRRRRSH